MKKLWLSNINFAEDLTNEFDFTIGKWSGDMRKVN